ncbi:MAG TPA: galactose oxidase-like domain-containing protein [Mycobacteriales bacterium]|nr:galactose oxidase-like domain-containing protein [Mycobacteriales bacterium]
MRKSGLFALVLAVAGLSGAAVPAVAAAPEAASTGSFGPLFEEPSSLAGDIDCTARDGAPNCKPAAMAVAVLPNGSELYWDGLEGMNRVQYNVVAEFGNVAQNDQSRLLTLGPGGPHWALPKPVDGGTNPNSGAGDYLPVVPHNNDATNNDSDLFCSSLVQLANGDLMSAGGTAYYLEPGVSGVPYGVSELEGLRVTRLYDPATNNWTFSGNMGYGRWYPSLVTLPSGNVFVASGVTKLIKPIYPNSPTNSGTNVKQTETYDTATGTWSYNGTTADKSLPLFPRLHLLPDGKVFYDAAGQTFNPDGQSYDEALWNMASVYDPSAKTWTDVGVPTIGGLPLGFRGSGFDVMLPLAPNAAGKYPTASFLAAGGVIGVTPGTYLATNTSTLDTIDTAHGDAFTSTATGALNNARWYSTGVVLPDGEVFAVNGANRDEVVAPGSGTPVTQAELYNPNTRTWQVAATETHGRTYHNTAVLLPDGSVLVGGHAPIATGYAFQTDQGTAIGLSKAESDPTFQIYYPPYFSYRVPRPTIEQAPERLSYDQVATISTPDAARISTVALVRNPSLTHLVDGDQRTVDLRIVGRSAEALRVAIPGPDVVPPGPYMLFVNARSAKGQVPSVSTQVFAGMPVPAYAVRAHELAAAHRTSAPARRVPARTLAEAALPATVHSVPATSGLAARNATSRGPLTDRRGLTWLGAAALVSGAAALGGFGFRRRRAQR